MAAFSSVTPLQTPNDIHSLADLEEHISICPTAKRYFETYAKAFPDQAAVLKEARHFEATGTLTGTVSVWKLERFFKMSRITGQAETFRENFHNACNLYYLASKALFVEKDTQKLDTLLENDHGDILSLLLFRAGQLDDKDAIAHLVSGSHGCEHTRMARVLKGASYAGHVHVLPLEPSYQDLVSILEGAAAGGRLHILKSHLPRFLKTWEPVSARHISRRLIIKATGCATGTQASLYLVKQVKVLWGSDEEYYKREVHRAGILGAIGSPSKDKLDRFLTTVPAAHMPRPSDMLKRAFKVRDPEVFQRLLLDKACELDLNSDEMFWWRTSQHPAFAAAFGPKGEHILSS